MISGDILGTVSVYVYVLILLGITEKMDDGLLSRKVLHIGVGNIIFLLPFFETRWVMAFVAAAPFIFITYLLSPKSPLGTVSRTSSKGHELGLVYYSISWTVLAFFFFPRLEVIAVGIAAMSYGDGFASLIGKRYGKRRYQIYGDEKSLEGSGTMFFVTLLTVLIAVTYYGRLDLLVLLIAPVVCFVATITEAVTPRGLDNLTISLSSAILYYITLYVLLD